MGNATLWVFIVIIIILVILVLLYIRWRHSKSELNYSKWVNDRVSGLFARSLVVTTAIFVNDRPSHRYLFQARNRDEYLFFCVLRTKHAVFDRVSQQLEC